MSLDGCPAARFITLPLSLSFVCPDWNGTAWSVSFDTAAGRTTEVKIPFRNLKATRFARSFDAGRPYNAKQLTAVQLTLSKFEYDGGLNPSFREGPFRLEIEEIGFY